MTLRLILVVILLAVMPSLAHALDPPSSPTHDKVAAFAERFNDEPLLVLQEWQGFEVRARSRDGGLSGDWITVDEYRVQSRAALEEASIVAIMDEPARQIKDVRVEVIRKDDRTTHRRKDLDWTEMTQRDDGVVILDGTYAMALIPGLRVGDTVQITRRWKLKGIHGFGSIGLGDPDRPVLRSRLEVWLPKEYQASGSIQANETFRPRVAHTETMVDRQVVLRWQLAAEADGSVPICEDEYPAAKVTPYIKHAGKDHRPSLVTGGTWEDVGRAYLASVEGKFDPSRAITEEATRLAEGSTDRMETIDRIYRAVQQQCRYLGLFEGMGGVIPIAAKEVHESGFGDCKGLGALLISMLRAAGIDAHPALVRTRDAGPLNTEAPDMAQFNHFIVWADDGQGGLFLDGTVDRYPAGRVPAGDTLSPVLLLHPDQVGLVEIDPESWNPGEIRIEVDGHLDQAGMLNLDVSRSYEGDASSWIRNRLADMRTSDREEYIANWVLADEIPFRARETDMVGLEEWAEPMVLTATASSRAPLPGTAGNILVPLSLSGDLASFNARAQCERSVDLRLWPSRRESWRIELPQGFALDRPDTVVVEVDGMQWTRSLWQEGDTLRLERSVVFGQAPVSPEEVVAIREAVSKARATESGYVALAKHGQ